MSALSSSQTASLIAEELIKWCPLIHFLKFVFSSSRRLGEENIADAICADVVATVANLGFLLCSLTDNLDISSDNWSSDMVYCADTDTDTDASVMLLGMRRPPHEQHLTSIFYLLY